MKYLCDASLWRVQPLSCSKVSTTQGGRGLCGTPNRVSWAPGTPTPLPSRERLHKVARGISDTVLEEGGY